MTNKLSRADYLRNLADAVEADEAGKAIQFERTDFFGVNEWSDYSRSVYGHMDTISANRWRIKPELREFQPGVLRDWLAEAECTDRTANVYVVVNGIVEPRSIKYLGKEWYSMRLVYDTREQAEAARKALGWSE